MVDDEVTSNEEIEDLTSGVEETEELSEEVESKEPSEESEEDSELEENLSDDDEPSRKYANKYRSVEELEKAYWHNSSETSAMAKELAALREEIRKSKMSPEERQLAEESQKFVKNNDLMTKSEFMQMQKDDQDLVSLRQRGANEHQLERVKRVANLKEYSKMSMIDVYKDLYGPLARVMPKQGVKQKARNKGGRRQYTPQEIQNMSAEEFNKNYQDIISRGVSK